MRLKAISLIVALVVLLPFGASAETSKFLEGDCRGPGGDGPKPMIKLPDFLTNIHPYGVDNGLSDGLFLPLTNRFAFRDFSAQLKVTKLATHSTATLATFNSPVAKIRDEQERFLIPEGVPHVFDTVARYWYSYKNAYQGKLKHLFWHGQTLYSAVVSEDDGRAPSFRLQRYTVGASRARRVCGLLNFALNSGYKLGEGHTFPYMVLHRTEKVGDERKLTVSLLNVNSCTIETKTYADLMKGDVKNVYYFADMKSMLIEVDHPTQQLVWDTGPDDKHCHYYSLNHSKFLVLGYKQPVIGAFDPYDGLSLIYMHDVNNNPPKTAQVTGDYPIADVKTFDLEINNEKDSLVGVTQLIDKSRTLIKIDVPKID